MKTFKEFIAEEGEAPLTTTANIEPKDQPNIRNESKGKKKKKKTGPKNWVAIGPNYGWGYANYGLYGGYSSGESSGDGGGGEGGGGM